MTPALAFSLAAYAVTCWTLRLLSKALDRNAHLARRNAELVSALEWQAEVMGGLVEEEMIEVEVECGCVRCRELEWRVN